MSRLYGNPQKFIRHINEDEFTLTKGKAFVYPFWYHDSNSTARVDGADLTDDRSIQTGSRVTKHFLEMLVEHTSSVPVKLYTGIIKLSFHDIFSPWVSGGVPVWNGTTLSITKTDPDFFGDSIMPGTAAHAKVTDSDADNDWLATEEQYTVTVEQVRADDNFKHYIPKLREYITYNEEPLYMPRKRLRVPAKVKRGNPYTFYALWLLNDSDPTTGVDLDFTIKSYFEEWAI